MNLFTLFGEVMLGLLEGAYLNFKELIISLRFGAPILGLLSEICSPCLFFCAVRLNSICYLVSSRVDCDCFFIPCYLGALSSICRVFESEGALRVLPGSLGTVTFNCYASTYLDIRDLFLRFMNIEWYS